jgi:hypothetical protein
MANVSGIFNPGSSLGKVAKAAPNKPEGGIKTAGDVLAYLREMMPGWTITTRASEWGEGVRNIEIDERILQKMADDPEAMVKFKALILDLEEAVPALEEWAAENEGKSLEFGFHIAANGQIQAIGIMRALLGGPPVRTVFELPEDKNTWLGFIQQKLDALAQGRVEDAEGNRSWVV